MESQRYQLAGRLGAGGMAEVLEGFVHGAGGFKRRVAIKRVLPHVATDPAFCRMFLDEARIASQLHHANVVSVIDYGVVDGVPFQVLEFIDGLDARTVLKSGTLPPEIALYVCVQIGHALTHAHDARAENGTALGIVHRDVSPANILLSWDGDVKLADFGIAFAKDRLERTEAGGAKGTLPYMSPEQTLATGVDGRADVFSLGCVLHALVVGKSPLVAGALGEFLASKRMVLDPAVPPDVRAIIERATQYRRDDRYADAAAFTEELGRAFAARATEDGRRLLQSHLAPLRPAAAPPPRGKLDGLLDVEIAFEESAAGTRKFATVATKVNETPALEESVSIPGASRKARRWPLLAIPLVGASLIGGFFALRHDERHADVPTATETSTASAGPAPSSAPSLITPPWASAVVVVVDAGGRVASRRFDAGRDAPVPTPSVSAAAPLTPPSDATGVVLFAGDDVQNADIYIDGVKNAAHPPKPLRLAVGSHDVKLVLADGRVIGPRKVVVSEHDTASSPLHFP